MVNTVTGKSTDQSKELVSLCRTGKLYEIAAGRSLEVPSATKRGRQPKLARNRCPDRIP